MPGGSYSRAPLYDVMSAYPFLSKKQVEARKIKMAMAARGKNSHYYWEQILYRHWLSTAQSCRYLVDDMALMIKELLEKMDGVIEETARGFPPDFPDDLARSIFDGMKAHWIDWFGIQIRKNEIGSRPKGNQDLFHV